MWEEKRAKREREWGGREGKSERQEERRAREKERRERGKREGPEREGGGLGHVEKRGDGETECACIFLHAYLNEWIHVYS